MTERLAIDMIADRIKSGELPPSARDVFASGSLEEPAPRRDI
jgi:hypothetical protein